jgi:hypothetical protein
MLLSPLLAGELPVRQFIDPVLKICIVVSHPFRKERGKDGAPCSVHFGTAHCAAVDRTACEQFSGLDSLASDEDWMISATNRAQQSMPRVLLMERW